MRKKVVVFGISKRFNNIMKMGILSWQEIDGLFDNSLDKSGTEMHGVKIQTPCYVEDSEVIITSAKRYHLDMLEQLIELGFRQISIVQGIEGNYFIQKLNFENINLEQCSRNLILLYLQHSSYSNIYAIKYLVENAYINAEPYEVKCIGTEENEQYYWDLMRAKYFITELDMSIHSSRIKKIQIWHGFPLKCMGVMDAKFDDRNREMIQAEWNRNDYILSYGKNYTTFISACFGTTINKFIVTGMPRNDLLFCTNGREKIYKIFPQSKGKKILLYMPTFREIRGRANGDKKGYIFNWPGFDIEMFEQFCAQNNVFFVFKLHIQDSALIEKWGYNSKNIGVLTEQLLGEQCTYQLLNGTDMLITDYSSVYFDYLLLNKPIIFTNRDEEEYIKNRGVILEPLDFWRPGAIVDNMESLRKEIILAISGKDRYKDRRKELMPFVHKFTDGKSTQRLFDFIRSNDNA